MADGASIEYEYTFKLIAVGDSSVGKTSLLKRFAHDTFDDKVKTTLGVEFMIRDIDLDNQRRCKMQVWDTAGQEKYAALTCNFFRGSHGILIVFDLSNRASFDNLHKWFDHAQWRWDDQQEKYIGPLPYTKVVLIGNKNDKTKERKVTFAEAKELAAYYHVEYAETSAKSGEHVLDTFIKMAKDLFDDRLHYEKEELKKQDERIRLHKSKQLLQEQDQQPVQRSKCCK